MERKRKHIRADRNLLETDTQGDAVEMHSQAVTNEPQRSVVLVGTCGRRREGWGYSASVSPFDFRSAVCWHQMRGRASA